MMYVNYTYCGNHFAIYGASHVVLVVKNLPANAEVRDPASIPGSGRSPGGGHGDPLHYSCLENPTDRGAGWATVLGITKSLTQLKRLTRLQPHLIQLHIFSVLPSHGFLYYFIVFKRQRCLGLCFGIFTLSLLPTLCKISKRYLLSNMQFTNLFFWFCYCCCRHVIIH